MNAFFNKVSKTFPLPISMYIIYYSPYHFSYKGLSIQKKWQIPIPHFFRLFHHLISSFFLLEKKKNNNTYLFIMIIFTSRIFYFIIEIFRPHAQSCRAQVLLSNQQLRFLVKADYRRDGVCRKDKENGEKSCFFFFY